MSSKAPVYPKTEREKTNDAYIKQMRPSAPGYVPLWDPTPMRDMSWDEVEIGDVGQVTQGYFRRLFNVTVPRSHILNGGRIPDNFVTLNFNSEKDTDVEYTSPVIQPQIPFFGDHLTCERVLGQDLDSGRSFRYKITKHEKGTSFVLLAPQDLIIERTLKQSKLDAWKEYAERHYQNWVNYAEDLFAAKVKPEELIFVRGWVKTPKWVVATLHRRGAYELYVDLAEELSATLTFGGRNVSEDTQLGEVRFGADVFGVRADMVREIIRTNGRPLPDCFRDGDPCTRCLFVKGLKVENSFWTPRRVVAAAEPQDPRSDDRGHGRTKTRAVDYAEDTSDHGSNDFHNSDKRYTEWRLRLQDHLLSSLDAADAFLRPPPLLSVCA